MIQTFSASKLREFLTCEKRYEYKYIDGLVPRTYQRALEFGSMGHRFLELWYKENSKSDLNIPIWTQKLREERGLDNFDAFGLQQFETDLFTVCGMIQAYIKFYEKDFDKYNIILAEEMLTVKETFNGWLLRGKPDLILQEKESLDIWIVDHKFLAQITQGLIKKLPLDYQVHAYLLMTKEWLALKGISGSLKGVIYNIVRKPSKRLKQNQTLAAYQLELFEDYSIRPDEFFYRENIIVTDHHTRNFAKFVDYVTKDLTRKHETLEFKQNVFACDQYGECPYLDLCLSGKELAEHRYKKWTREIV